MASYSEELLDKDTQSDTDELHDIALDEEEEKSMTLPDTLSTGEPNNDDIDNDDEKYPTFRQINFTFDEHTSFWEDDMVPASILSFLFMICGIIAYFGYSMNIGGNKYIAGIGSFGIWSIITLIFILFDRNNSEHKMNEKLKIKNTNEYNNTDDYQPYHSDDEDDNNNLLR
eukprot:333934_1